MKKLLCCALSAICLFSATYIPGSSVAAEAAVYEKHGDADGNKTVTSADALLVLQYSVGKITLKAEALAWCDVDDNGIVNSSDALQILQYSVGKIKRFSGDSTPYTQEEYNEMLSSLSYDTPASGVSDAYEIASDGGMIYNPLSREAKANGTLGKYKNAKVTTGTLKLSDSTELIYSMPTDCTAYDMVPITYTITSADGYSPVYFEATAAEDTAKYGDNEYFDCTLPNNVQLDFEFLGYVNGTKNTSNRPYNSVDFSNDTQGTQYPQYDVSELIASSTVQRSQYTWYRFKYTNTGDTVLDSDGNGTFCFEPILEKLGSDGSYSTYLVPSNVYYRITDTLYPGESGTVDFIFTWNRDGGSGTTPPAAGDYRIKILSEVRNETSNPENYGTTIWGGHTYCTSYFDFKIAKSAADTPIEKVKTTVKKAPVRNTWLHSYEEFLTSYDSYLSPGKIDNTELYTMYLQPAPWTESVVLKLIRGNDSLIDTAVIPVNVESDSIKVSLNTTAQNYIIKDDGTKYPAMATQSMADMRVNSSLGPDSAGNILNELIDMKESGINLVTTTAAYELDLTGKGSVNDRTDANWFMCDAVRLLDMKLEGYIAYPYNDINNISKARVISKNTELFPAGYKITDVADKILAKACGIKALYQFLSWGDNYYVTGKGTVPITTEDSRGHMRIYFSARETLADTSKADFRSFLADKYGTVAALNKAWGKGYESFDEIDPEFGTTLDHDLPCYTASSADFTEWSKAVNDLDVFRTEQRVDNYTDILNEVSDTFNAVISFRTEGANWTSVVPYNTENQHYRHVYYSQRRGAMIPEILSASGIIKMHSDYTTMAYLPSEVSYLTRSSVSLGITPMHLAMFDRFHDIAINSRYGQDYSKEYNLTGSGSLGVHINTTRSLFQWFKATYEAGGIPGILWEDWYCDGFATQTQIKEMKFYSEKIAEAVASESGQKWMASNTTNAKAAVEASHGRFSYPAEYVQSLIDKTLEERKSESK